MIQISLNDAKPCNVDHRWEWLVDQIKLLSSVFAIEIATYAVMSNHYDLVVKWYKG
ncbi:hypothetical protein [Pseudoalteromonas sp. SaAl2]